VGIADTDLRSHPAGSPSWQGPPAADGWVEEYGPGAVGEDQNRVDVFVGPYSLLAQRDTGDNSRGAGLVEDVVFVIGVPEFVDGGGPFLGSAMGLSTGVLPVTCLVCQGASAMCSRRENEGRPARM